MQIVHMEKRNIIEHHQHTPGLFRHRYVLSTLLSTKISIWRGRVSRGHERGRLVGRTKTEWSFYFFFFHRYMTKSPFRFTIVRLLYVKFFLLLFSKKI